MVPAQNERKWHHAFRNITHLMTGGCVLNAKLYLTLGIASLSAAWLARGIQRYPRFVILQLLPAGLFLMSGVMFIDDSRSDDHQFIWGEFVCYGSVLLWQP